MWKPEKAVSVLFCYSLLLSVRQSLRNWGSVFSPWLKASNPVQSWGCRHFWEHLSYCVGAGILIYFVVENARMLTINNCVACFPHLHLCWSLWGHYWAGFSCCTQFWASVLRPCLSTVYSAQSLDWLLTEAGGRAWYKGNLWLKWGRILSAFWKAVCSGLGLHARLKQGSLLLRSPQSSAKISK